MYDMYWFLDSVPTHDLGLTKDTIVNGEDYYVIGGIEGDLGSIIEVYEKLGLSKNSQGRKFVKKPENLHLANTVLNNLIDSGKILVFGTVFYHSQIPPIIQQWPDRYISSDNPIEVGIIGMRGRAFAQTIWIFMDYILKKRPDTNPIVCLDNEDPIIQQSVKFHFKGQFAGKPDAEVKVQSIDRARENEPKGYIVSDIVCSMLGKYVKFPDRYGILEKLITKTIKFDSKLEVEHINGIQLRGRFRTDLVPQWALSNVQLFRPTPKFI